MEAAVTSQENLATTASPLEHYTRNAWALASDSALFTIGMSLTSATTVLPAFVATLTDSEMLVGVASGLSTAAWLLPQLLIASMISHRPRQKPLIVGAAFASRPLYFVAGLVIWSLGTTRPTLSLAIMLATIAIFFTGDAVVSVPWFALLGKLIPLRRRGRVVGLSQVAGGLGGIAAGGAVSYLLSEESAIAFPGNFAVLYMAASIMFLLSAVALACIKEPVSDTVPRGDQPSTREILRELPRLIANDRPFLAMQMVRILAGFVALASAFYVLHATRILGLPLSATGLFVSAQVAGTLAAGLAMSLLQDRAGPLVHMRVVVLASCFVPALALGITASASALGSGLLYAYLGLFFFLGLVNGSAGWPYYNWILEYADETRRPLYIGVSNTLGAASMLAYPLGGWIVSAFSYPTAFVLALVFGLAALVLSLRVPSVR